MSRPSLESSSNYFLLIRHQNASGRFFDDDIQIFERISRRRSRSACTFGEDAENIRHSGEMSGLPSQTDQSFDKFLEVIVNLDSNIKQEFVALRQQISQSHTTLSIEKPGGTETADLVKKNKDLEDQIKQLEQTLVHTKQAARRGIEENQAKATRLHKIIIDSGLNDTGPIDDEVERTFSALNHAIFQFVIKHCRNDNYKKLQHYNHLPPDAQNWYVVMKIALRIYDELFAPKRLCFGFASAGADEALAKIEESLQKNNKIPLSEIVDWRVRTCQLSKHSNPQTRMNEVLCNDRVSEMYDQLGPFWHHGPQELKRRSIEIRLSLEDLYQQAFKAVMLIRRAKTEYRWLQRDRDWFRPQPLRDDEVEVVASAGVYHSFAEAMQAGEKNIVTVFGEVIKGDGPSGQVAESWHLLQKCSVLLGTPEKGSR